MASNNNKASEYEAYKASKNVFDQAEEAYQLAQQALDKATRERSEKEVILRDAKHDMDKAYQIWRGEETTSTSVPQNDNNRSQEESSRNKRKQGEGVYVSMEEQQQQHRRQSHPPPRERGYSSNNNNNNDSNRMPYQDPRRRGGASAPYNDDTGDRSRNSNLTSAPAAAAVSTSTLSNNKNEPDPSIFIPFVHTNISEHRIKEIIESKGWGIVDRVDLKALPPRMGKPPINRAYIHFVTWLPQAERQRQEYLTLTPGGNVPLVYDDPWFWKTMPNKPPAARGRTF